VLAFPSRPRFDVGMRRLLLLTLLFPYLVQAENEIGVRGAIGAPAGSPVLGRLEITEPGVYENMVIDGEFRSGNLVKITADDVILRNCEIRQSSGNGIGVFGTRVLIENCHIHHLLAGSFEDQEDAHGIAGQWGEVTIRNCEISHPSGDCIQFDPDRLSSGSLMVERCTLWTALLKSDLAGFKAGQRPGENALDTKVKGEGPRCQLVIRDCHFHGWNQPAPIDNIAALNLKENVDAEVVRCLFQDNEIAVRARGPGERGGAQVRLTDCAIFDTKTAIRAEDGIQILELSRVGFGGVIGRRFHFAGGETGPGFLSTGEYEAALPDALLRRGFPVP
jgi:hypothetical protein